MIRIELDNGQKIDVTGAVQIMYDAVVGSLDWGSGFLDAEEMSTILQFAALAKYDYGEQASAARRYHGVKLSGPLALAADEADAYREKQWRQAAAQRRAIDQEAEQAKAMIGKYDPERWAWAAEQARATDF